MTGRDRMVLIGVIVLAAVAAGWMFLVSPERQKANSLSGEVSTAKTALATAEGQLASARAAEAQYSKAYASVVRLGKAVPASEEVPSLIYQLAQATNQRNVDFSSIVTGSAGGSTTPATGSGPVASAGFSQMPFTFVFNGGFFDLERLFRQMTAFANHTGSGGLEVRGRLLTIQSVKLSPEASSSPTGGKQGLSGTITASAYVLPASQGLTAGATPTSPTGATATPSSASAAPTSPTAPAVARVTP